MLKNIYTNSILIISIFLLAISCDKGEPAVVHEHEVFTRVVIEIKEDLAMKIKHSVETIGLNFAFPSHSIYIEKT